MFKKILTLVVATTCGINATASGISIESSSGGSNRIPVVFELKGEAVNTAARSLESTKIFTTTIGSCEKHSHKIGQDVICVSSDGGSAVEIDVPNRSKLRIGYIDSYQDLASKIYIAALNSKASPFETKLALVTKNKTTGKYVLSVTDYKGTDGKVLLHSPMPILSPSWSPNGKYLTYVSFETYRTSIFVQNVESGVRLKVFEVRGLNAFPKFKDNRTLVFSLSGEKRNSNIVEFDLLTKKVKPLISSPKHSDVYPVPVANGTVFVRMFKDIPYLYGKTRKGQIYQLSKSPNNLPTANENGSVLASSIGGYIYIWDMLNKKVTEKINTKDRVESLSISAKAQSYYYVTERKDGYALVSYTAYGSKMFELKTSDADVIQVSAK
ncbi:hypothetical protein [Vibrio sp. D431a]|uniref:hypothetical protein n=1 Tax=Vibrio sp. D431a TaxID=2837388 RepID=UPI0025563181|nr:hypothetical protein [Vibrio sp. D431a]MDK9793228.1 PD40 domain-containing protein [Vibrio sp. D431a]